MSDQKTEPTHHVSVRAYRKGCRCEGCRKANAEYQRDYQSRKGATYQREYQARAPRREPVGVK